MTIYFYCIHDQFYVVRYFMSMSLRTRYERCSTPSAKQCFVVSSVILNMISYGLTTGYNATLFSELRKTREIALDIHSESWLASMMGITLFVGSVIGSLVMETIGRRSAVLMSSIFMICGWTSFSFASSFPVLFIAKLFQGISAGIGTNVGSILIAEYSSPKYRGSFIATIPTGLLLGIFISHTFGMFYGWHQLCIILLFFSLPGLIAIVFSPESPSFLVTKGRYDECRKIFRWLRGTDEDDELETMIKTNMILQETKKVEFCNVSKLIQNKLAYGVTAFKKKEFRIPVLIMMHLSAIMQFSGSLVCDMYALDVHTALYGTDVYMFKVMTSLDVLRLVATVSAVYITSRVRRRSMLLVFVSLNIVTDLCIAGHVYARQHGLLPFDHWAISLFLHHFLYFIIGTGSMPLAIIIGGEIFPLADRGFCSVISRIFCSVYMFVNIKSAPYLFSSVGVDGAFSLYALIHSYSLIVTLILLPETKDKTLERIEDEFRGHTIANHEEAFEMKDYDVRDDGD
ncbi:facilitated trehalose transporter Tret1-2 homolog isoform X1 [Bombyx mandarina]|uniref:Facilitated trehalose transporter Tret1-2 homolog isoform X1 n=2 Tax=Bombyx mandarina TaxID=7092 RepID=A0A6J2KQA3_BOMMA|nr:facilitated trehalose transporter Tret1-2 homolog isoform X1 [Bombyx mandarina]